MKVIKIGKKMIYLALAILMILITSFALISSFFGNGIDVVRKEELNNVEKILEKLPSITQDFGSVNTISDNIADIPAQRSI